MFSVILTATIVLCFMIHRAFRFMLGGEAVRIGVILGDGVWSRT